MRRPSEKFQTAFSVDNKKALSEYERLLLKTGLANRNRTCILRLGGRRSYPLNYGEALRRDFKPFRQKTISRRQSKGPTGMPPTKATPMTVPINNPVTKTGCSLINGTPRPASHATKMPIRTAAIILKLINSKPAESGFYRKPAGSIRRWSAG